MRSTGPSRRDSTSVGLRGERGAVLSAVMLTTALVAVDATILAAAVPAVVRDLGGLAQFPWLFSVYVLTQAVSIPVYGRLSDLYGRKPVMLLGISVFIAGSVLCGLAWSMPALIAFRAVQGLGAGAIKPVGITIVGDLYSIAERAKVQGYIASVWAVSSLVGPALGGILSEVASWRWIFLVNLPSGIAALVMLSRRYSDEPVVRETRPHLDLVGSALLVAGSLCLLCTLLEGGVLWAWSSPVGIALPVLSAAFLVAFVAVQRRRVDPLLPLRVLSRPPVAAAMTASFVVGVVLLGLTSYVPLYAQAVLGTSATAAGFVLAGMTVGWPVGATASGPLQLRHGFRATLLAGTAVAAAGAALLLVVRAERPVTVLAVACCVMGLGFGMIASPSIVAAQSAVSWEERGSTTGAVIFARSIGSAVGVAIFGAVVNTVVGRRGSTSTGLDAVPSTVLAAGLERAWWVAAVAVGLLFLPALAMPRSVDLAAPEAGPAPTRRAMEGEPP